MTKKSLLIVFVILSFTDIYAQISQPDSLFALARAKYTEGKLEISEDLVRNALDFNMFHPEYKLLLGDVLFARKQFDEAIEEYQNAAVAGNSGASFRISQAAAILGKAEIAVYYLKKDFDSKDRTLPFYVNSNSSFETVRNTSQFINFQKNNIFSSTEILLSDALYAQSVGNFAESFSILNSILSKSPKKHQALALRGDLHFAEKNYKIALENYEKAVELSPKNQIYLEKRANSYLQLGKNKKALLDFQSILNSAPYRTELCKNIAECQLKSSDNEGAILNLKRYSFYYTSDSEAVEMLIQAELNAEKLQDALIHANALVKSKQNLETYRLRGDVRSEMKLYDEAFADYAQCLDLAPNSGEIWFKAGLALQNAGKIAQACEYLQKAVSYGYFIASDFMSDCK